MNFDRDYYYIEFDEKSTKLTETQKNKTELIKKNISNNIISKEVTHDYLILNETDLIGFFSLNLEEDYIKISLLYICKKYRNKNIATEIIYDVIFAVKYNNLNYTVDYLVVNTYVEYALFFLKRGFDFCKLNKKLDYKKKNMILMYKKI